jgi:NAD(P)-dependent dehydrogenase (short-subunit alcohol dehydrogenase family)
MTGRKRKKYDDPVSATLTGIMDLFRKQEPAGELKPTDRLDGKTVLVDGASSGLGFAIAVEVARRGARLIMACRSGIPEKGEEVKKRSGNADVCMVHVDFADIRSINQLINELRSASLFGDGAGSGVKIDVFICNAGIVPKQSRRTPQGLEEMFMVNYFSKFIFVNLLLDNHCFNVQGPGIPRIIFVASESHRNPEKFEWDEFGKYMEYQIGKSIELYGYYKLLLTTFSVELSRRLNPGVGTNYSVFSLCPGPVNSNIAREAPKVFLPLLKLVFGLFFKSPSKAAVPVIYLASSGDVKGKTFDYLFLMSRKEVDEKSSDPENGRRLWELSEKLWQSLNKGI